MADTKLSALSLISAPTTDDYVYLVDDPGGTPASAAIDMSRFGGFLLPSTAGGRLTLTSGTAVTTADVTGATNVYYTPYVHDRISIFDGTRWKLYTFSELTLAVGTLSSGKPYDVFIYDNSGTLTLESLAWTDDTNRATALTTQNGVAVKTGATTRRYLGTFYTTATTTTEDSFANRYLYNHLNQVTRFGRNSDATSHGYSGATRQEWNNGTNAPRCNFVLGDAQYVQGIFTVQFASGASSTSAGASLGKDSTTTSWVSRFGIGTSQASLAFQAGSGTGDTIAAGKHYITLQEFADGTHSATFTSCGVLIQLFN